MIITITHPVRITLDDVGSLGAVRQHACGSSSRAPNDPTTGGPYARNSGGAHKPRALRVNLPDGSLVLGPRANSTITYLK